MKAIVALALCALTLTILVATSEAQENNHWPYGGCNCQCCGENGGHCHCADGQQIRDVNCRWGGNHWICFPWQYRGGEGACFNDLPGQNRDCGNTMGWSYSATVASNDKLPSAGIRVRLILDKLLLLSNSIKLSISMYKSRQRGPSRLFKIAETPQNLGAWAQHLWSNIIIMITD